MDEPRVELGDETEQEDAEDEQSESDDDVSTPQNSLHTKVTYSMLRLKSLWPQLRVHWIFGMYT